MGRQRRPFAAGRVAVKNNEIQVFWGNGNPALAGRICDYLEVKPGRALITRFPDGELRVKLDDDVRGRDVFLVQPTCPPVNENLMELLLMIDAARRASARRVTAVMPYYGYGRMDRKDEGRVPITAKLVANMLTTAGASRVLTLDLHATQIQGFFDIPVDHLFAAPLFARALQKSGLDDVIVVAPDPGSIKLARAYAGLLKREFALVDKHRVSPDLTQAGFVIGNVAGKRVLLVDDMIATGSSTAEAARALKEKGALEVYVAATHAVFCGPAKERLAASPIRQLYVSDSIPVKDDYPELADRTDVVSVAPLLGEAIRRIHEDESVSALFARLG